MAKYNGLIIPRSYNDYFSRSDPQAIKDIIATGTDAALDTESENPIQNKAVAQLIPAAADVNNKLVLSSEVAAIETDVNNIKNIIPTAASENNELADKNFVNSTVGTNTANYIYKTNVGGEKVPFNSIEELEAYSGTVTQNDYALVTGTDENGNIYFDHYKADVNDDVVTWAKEYRLNNSSFTAEQWAAIQSGITSNLVEQIESVIGNTTLFVATTCDAAGSAEIKEITLDGVAIISGALIGVTFTNANTYGETTATTPTNPKLQINNVNYDICDSRGHIAGKGCWNAGDYVEFRIAGNKAIIINGDIREQVTGESGYTIYSDNKIVYGTHIDYKNKTRITLPYTSEKDGFIYVLFNVSGSANYLNISIEDVKFTYNGGSAGATDIIPIKKNDVVKLISTNQSSAVQIYFVPMIL